MFRGKCPGGKCTWGICPWGICPWGKCPRGTCPGGFCPVTLRLDYCGFRPFCSTGTKLLLSISLLMVLICII